MLSRRQLQGFVRWRCGRTLFSSSMILGRAAIPGNAPKEVIYSSTFIIASNGVGGIRPLLVLPLSIWETLIKITRNAAPMMARIITGSLAAPIILTKIQITPPTTAPKTAPTRRKVGRAMISSPPPYGIYPILSFSCSANPVRSNGAPRVPPNAPRHISLTFVFFNAAIIMEPSNARIDRAARTRQTDKPRR